jgi:hypothetical protein
VSQKKQSLLQTIIDNNRTLASSCGISTDSCITSNARQRETRAEKLHSQAPDPRQTSPRENSRPSLVALRRSTQHHCHFHLFTRTCAGKKKQNNKSFFFPTHTRIARPVVKVAQMLGGE